MYFVRCMALTAAAFSWAGAATAQENYPNKVVRIVTSEPGSTNDLVARMVARGLTAGIGQTIIENRGGISPEVVARAPADGYNILFFGNAAWIMPLFRKMSYEPQRDLTAVSTGCSQPTVLAVHPSLPVKNVKDVIALARARPGQINYGVGATIAGPTLAMEIFKNMVKVDMVKINYRGTGPAANALMASGAAAADLVINFDDLNPGPKAAFDAAIAKFKAENPDINVIVNNNDREAHKTAIRNFLSADSPDLANWYAGNRMAPFVKAGLFEPVDDVWEASGFNEQLKSTAASMTIDGKQWGVPYTYYQWGIYFNRDAYKAAGAEEPKNWEEFVANCDKFKAAAQCLVFDFCRPVKITAHGQSGALGA